MLPTDEVFGGWPASGEIDIMENIGSEPARIHGTLHYGASSQSHQQSGTAFDLVAGAFADSFHEIALEKEPGVLRWFVDDVFRDRALFFGSLFGGLFAAVFCLIAWRWGALAVTGALVFAAITGALFGALMSAFGEHAKQRLGLPSWSRYPAPPVGDGSAEPADPDAEAASRS